MKKMISLLMLTLSLSSFAQEKVSLNNSEIIVPNSSATLVRTSATPEKVEVTFQNIRMEYSYCAQRLERTVTYPCTVNRTVYRSERYCPSPNAMNPRPGCYTRQVPNGSILVTNTCSRRESYCADLQTREGLPITDKVKIKFKNVPNLGGTEEDTFFVEARQNGRDSSNIIYSIHHTSPETNRFYNIVKKGIFGYDSYVIESK